MYIYIHTINCCKSLVCQSPSAFFHDIMASSHRPCHRRHGLGHGGQYGLREDSNEQIQSCEILKFSSTTFDFDGEWFDWPARNRKDVHYHDSAHRHIPKQICVTSVWGWKNFTPGSDSMKTHRVFLRVMDWEGDSMTVSPSSFMQMVFVSPDAWSLSCWVVVLKIVYFHPLFGEMIPFDEHMFQMKPPTRLF